MKHKLIVIMLVWAGMLNTSNAQVQKGNDINGETAGDLAGQSVSMPDGNIIAIGARYNGGNGVYAGQVRIFEWNGTDWVQKGGDIDGEAEGDQSGWSVCMPEANTVAIGAPYNDAGVSGADRGQVRVYQWNGTAWVQKGGDIDGESDSDLSGCAVSMPDANTLAVGAKYNDGNGSNDVGHVRIYQWNGSAWIQKGSDIDGEASGDQSGIAVSMPDLNTVAIGATGNDDNGVGSGQVRIYTWNGTAWIQKGSDIDGEAASDFSGCSVGMPDANTIAIGAWSNDGNGADAGQVRIYTWLGSTWVQKGSDIDGPAATDNLGLALSMPDANTLGVGAWGDDITGADAGRTIVYNWNGSGWQQKGASIFGQAAGDHSGWSVSMPDSNTIATGATYRDANGNDAGNARIYTFRTNTGVAQNNLAAIRLYPNPTSGSLFIDFGENRNALVSVKNMLGQEVDRVVVVQQTTLRLSVEGNAGLYFIEIIDNSPKLVLPVIKK